MGETSNANLLTMGSIPKKIIMFAIPLLWGNLFQQLYNVADSLIVGNFLGNNALAAVRSSGNLILAWEPVLSLRGILEPENMRS